VTALMTVDTALAARQRAGRALLTANEALEQRAPELEEQHEWFRVTLSSIGDAVIVADVQGHVTFLNPVAEAMTGWQQNEAQGKPLANIFQIINEDPRQPAENPLERVLRAGRVVGLANHTALISRSGVEFAIEDSAAPIMDSGGQLVGAVIVFHDVSRRRKAERALRTSEERLRAVFAQASVGIAVVGLDGRIQEVNKKFCDILGYSLEELRERTVLGITHPDDRDITQTQVQRLLEGSAESYTLEKRYIRKDGTLVWGNTNVTVLRQEDGTAAQFIGVTEDIT